MPLPFPSFYEPERVASLHLERAALIAEHAESWAAQHGVRPAAEDTLKLAAFGVDVQAAFCLPEASLFVPGAVEDTRRTIEWLYRNLDRITGLYFTLDTHRVFQIFHPVWWVDRDGKPPAPLTPIYAADVRAGRWTPTAHPEESLEYCTKLEASGKYVLTIWPYHALLGGMSHGLVPSMMEAALFHALVRRSQTHFETKGTHPLTEHYSVLAPEVRELGGKVVGTFNTQFMELLLEHDRVYLFGQAKSHCVLATLHDVREYILSKDPALADRIYILEDAMSPVPAPHLDPLPPALDFPLIAEEAMEEFRSVGMHVVRTTDPIAP